MPHATKPSADSGRTCPGSFCNTVAQQGVCCVHTTLPAAPTGRGTSLALRPVVPSSLSRRAVLVLTVAVGCDATPGIPEPSVDSIAIWPPRTSVALGNQQWFIPALFDSAGRALPERTITWDIDDTTVAAVNPAGLVTGRMPGTTIVTGRYGNVSGSVTLTVRPTTQPPGDIVLDSGLRHQTIQGWEVKTWISQWGCPDGSGFDLAMLDRYRGAVLDSAVALGITRARLEIRAGAERPDDRFAAFRANQIDYSEYRKSFYHAVNDNDDPYSIDSAGFHFGEIDYEMEQVILPFRDRLRERGVDLYLNLNFVDFGRRGGFEHWTDPEEYAELMLAAFLHLQRKFGVVPDAVEIILEPDNGPPLTPKQIGEALVATGRRLEAAGFTPDFIAPSTTVMSAATRYLDEMLRVPGVRSYLTELSYHRYGGTLASQLEEIGLRAIQYGLRTAMLEHIGSGYEDLHADLKIGRNSAWQQFALGGCAPGDDGTRLLLIDSADPESPVVRLAGRTRFLSRYFQHVRPGAVRIHAMSTRETLDPLAFINPDGGWVVVVKAVEATTFQIGGLPPGRYRTLSTTGPDETTADTTVEGEVRSTGGPVTVSIPGRGVLTLAPSSSP